MKIQQWLFELLSKQSVTDGRTDNVKTVYPLQTKFAGGIKTEKEYFLYVYGWKKNGQVQAVAISWDSRL